MSLSSAVAPALQFLTELVLCQDVGNVEDGERGMVAVARKGSVNLAVCGDGLELDRFHIPVDHHLRTPQIISCKLGSSARVRVAACDEPVAVTGGCVALRAVWRKAKTRLAAKQRREIVVQQDEVVSRRIKRRVEHVGAGRCRAARR